MPYFIYIWRRKHAVVAGFSNVHGGALMGAQSRCTTFIIDADKYPLLGVCVCVCVCLNNRLKMNIHSQVMVLLPHISSLCGTATLLHARLSSTHMFTLTCVCDCVIVCARLQHSGDAAPASCVIPRLWFQKALQVSALGVNTHTDTHFDE